MRAKLEDLGPDKYYATRLKVWDDNGNSVGSIELNLRGNVTTPSDRFRAQYLEMYTEQYPNGLVDMDTLTEWWQNEICTDDHYETQVTYEVALQIERCLNANDQTS